MSAALVQRLIFDELTCPECGSFVDLWELLAVIDDHALTETERIAVCESCEHIWSVGHSVSTIEGRPGTEGDSP